MEKKYLVGNGFNSNQLLTHIDYNLIKENPDGFNIIEGLFSEYTIKKGEIIRQIAKKAGFNGYRFMILTDRNEIETYKKFMNLEKAAVGYLEHLFAIFFV